MPYKSLAQERFFHTNTAKEKGIKPNIIKEFDKASKGMKLPSKVKKDRFSRMKKMWSGS